jgi:glycosyltransferase involved in cell wall biosynthesis
MAQRLREAHVVALPSYYGEGVPKILLEAAASGRAAVTTDWPGCRDTVQHRETGLLVAPRDPRGLAEAIAYLLEHPEERQRMGKNARKRAERQFSVEQFAKKMTGIYGRMLHRAGA